MGQFVLPDTGIPYTKSQNRAWRDVLLTCKCGFSDVMLVCDEIGLDGIAEDINYHATLEAMKHSNADHLKHGCRIGYGVVA